jgi:hypothetical protein
MPRKSQPKGSASSITTKRKTGYRHIKPDEVAAALRATNGMITLAAQKLACDPQTVRNHIAKSPELKQILDDSRDNLLDLAETALKSAVLAKEGWAVCFTLKTVGKGRGYVERIEQTGADGGALKVQVIYGGGDDDANDSE